MNNYYVYFYLRKDGCPYYVGKGRNRRAFNQHNGFNPPADTRRIVFPHKDLDEFESFYWERFWIDFYGRKDIGTGILHNKTNGGQGTSGIVKVTSEETKAKQSIAAKNRSAASNKKISEAKKGSVPWNKGRKETREEVLKRQSESHQNPSEEVRKKNADGHRNKKASDETRKKMSDAKKGKTAHNKGKKMTIVMCPHCNKSGGSSGMKKYHFDRCKFKLT